MYQTAICAECTRPATQVRTLVHVGLAVIDGEDLATIPVPLCDLHGSLVQCDIDDGAPDALYRLPAREATE